MQVTIKANDGSKIYEGYIDEMPEYGEYVDIYEEAVNMRIESGITGKGWIWEVA